MASTENLLAESLIFCLTLYFTVNYWRTPDHLFEFFCGVFSSVLWSVLGQIWLIIHSSYWSISWLFYSFSILYVLLSIYSALQMLQIRKDQSSEYRIT